MTPQLLILIVLSGLAASAVTFLVYAVLQIKRAVDQSGRLAISTHMLVNSAMGAQLKLTAETSRALANTAPDNPVYATAAATAERLLAEHAEKQLRADEWQGLVSGGARG